MRKHTSLKQLLRMPPVLSNTMRSKLTFFSLFIPLSLSHTNVSAEDTPPNIIFLLSDDQHWNETSVQMHPDHPASKSDVYQTPNLEKLASQGMRFSAAYAPAPVCAPTRISIQTGMSPAALHWCKIGPSRTASANTKLIPPVNRNSIEKEATFPQFLQKAGYATAHFGKWNIDGGGPENYGYDVSDGNLSNEASDKFSEPDNPTDIFGMTSRAVQFMEQQKKANKPFYIQLSYLALHSVYHASPKNISKFEKLGNYTRERDLQRRALTLDLDEGVGKLMQAIEELQLADNTIVIYMSDNGAQSMGNKVISGSKGSLQEGGIRAVFIARGPQIPANSWSHERIVGYDLFPTFCKLAGVTEKLPTSLEGGDITPLLHGKPVQVERKQEGMVFHFPHYQNTAPASAIYHEEFKLIKDYETGNISLYNIDKDLSESNDLSKTQVKKATELKNLLEQQLKELDAQFPTINNSYDPSKPTAERKGGKGKKGGPRK